MKRFFFGLPLIMLLILCCTTAPAVSASTGKLPSGMSYDDIETSIDAYVKEHKNTTVGMECAVFDKNDVIFQKQYGYINKEDKIALKEDSVLDWGSITKTLIWVSAMQLWESGQLDFEKDIREYLPDGYLNFLRYDSPITFTNLMNHQGGFQESMSDIYLQDYDRILPLNEQLQKNPPIQIFEPGTVTAYSNWGSALAAYVLECVSKETFDNYVRKHIFEPLEMNHTAIRPDLSDQKGILEKRLECKGYWSNGTRRSVSFYYISLYPCGMCTGTMGDLILYTQALIPDNDKPCPLFQKKETLQQLLSPTSYIGDSKNARICHGFLVDYYGVPVLGHGGNSACCSSQICIDTASGIGTVVMTNQYLEEVYTQKMMPLIYGTYDSSSNLGMHKTSKEQYVRYSNTIWEGPLSILNMLLSKTLYTIPEDDIPWFFSEKEKRFEFADTCDLVAISPQAFYLDTTLILLLPIILLYLVTTSGIHGLIIQPLRKRRHKKQNIELSPNLLARWHYISCGLIAIWMINLAVMVYQVLLANSPSEYYLWQIGMNGILGILMIAAIIAMWRNYLCIKKEHTQKGFWKLTPYITGFCLLVCIIIIIRFDMYQFWRL